jgi:hypothetical protein
MFPSFLQSLDGGWHHQAILSVEAAAFLGAWVSSGRVWTRRLSRPSSIDRPSSDDITVAHINHAFAAPSWLGGHRAFGDNGLPGKRL